jgi:hypothetical protein
MFISKALSFLWNSDGKIPFYDKGQIPWTQIKIPPFFRFYNKDLAGREYSVP